MNPGELLRTRHSRAVVAQHWLHLGVNWKALKIPSVQAANKSDSLKTGIQSSVLFKASQGFQNVVEIQKDALKGFSSCLEQCFCNFNVPASPGDLANAAHSGSVALVLRFCISKKLPSRCGSC